MIKKTRFTGLIFLIISLALIPLFKNVLYAYLFIVAATVAYVLWKKMHMVYSSRIRDLESAKSGFISLISHELKTPITSIKGFSELLIREEAGGLNDMQKDFLTTVLKSTKNLETKIDNIIELSNNGLKRTKLKKERVEWTVLISEVTADFQRSFEYKKLNVSVQLDDTIPPVLVDPEKMKKALSNIILNAIKFTEPGGHISIATYSRGDFFETTITDTGRGVSKGLKKRMFEQFVQEETDPTIRDNDGLGIGLTLTKNIIKQHGGQVSLNSCEDGGTKVTFILHINRKN